MSGNHEELWTLAERVAEESILIDAAEQMITNDDMRARLSGWKAANDQRWLAALRNAANALIALEKLGYTVTGP